MSEILERYGVEFQGCGDCRLPQVRNYGRPTYGRLVYSPPSPEEAQALSGCGDCGSPRPAPAAAPIWTTPLPALRAPDALQGLDGWFDYIIKGATGAVKGAVGAFKSKPKEAAKPTQQMTLDPQGRPVMVITQAGQAPQIVSLQQPASGTSWKTPVAIGVGALALLAVGVAVVKASSRKE